MTQGSMHPPQDADFNGKEFGTASDASIAREAWHTYRALFAPYHDEHRASRGDSAFEDAYDCFERFCAEFPTNDERLEFVSKVRNRIGTVKRGINLYLANPRATPLVGENPDEYSLDTSIDEYDR